MSTDINKLPHLDTATGPGEYQWCGVRVEITMDDMGFFRSRVHCRGAALTPSLGVTGFDAAVRASKKEAAGWSSLIRDRLIREHAWLLDLMRSVYDCRPDSDTIMERMREETQ